MLSAFEPVCRRERRRARRGAAPHLVRRARRRRAAQRKRCGRTGRRRRGRRARRRRPRTRAALETSLKSYPSVRDRGTTAARRRRRTRGARGVASRPRRARGTPRGGSTPGRPRGSTATPALQRAALDERCRDRGGRHPDRLDLARVPDPAGRSGRGVDHRTLPSPSRVYVPWPEHSSSADAAAKRHESAASAYARDARMPVCRRGRHEVWQPRVVGLPEHVTTILTRRAHADGARHQEIARLSAGGTQCEKLRVCAYESSTLPRAGRSRNFFPLSRRGREAAARSCATASRAAYVRALSQCAKMTPPRMCTKRRT